MTTLFFLHGVGGGRAAWDRQVPYFSARGYRCVAWDQPGYGGAPPVEPYTFEAIAKALQQQTAEPAVLVGHSMGGMVAQETCARYPEKVKALVLSFTSPAFAGGGEFARQFIAARVGALDAGRTMAEVAAALMPTLRGTKSDPEGVALAIRTMAAVPPDTYRKAVHLLTTFDRRADLAKIRVPTLLVAGSDDRVAPPAIHEKMSKRIPGAKYALLEGCGHLGPMDQPQAFNEVVFSFLKRI
ncbi:MAG: alpha/beta fold hydrolase [Betaproteobacteria bacterium]